MAEIAFGENYSDLSVQSGANAGFQFEFNCERCNDRWRTEFVPYRGARAASWTEGASGFPGGVVGEAASGVEGPAQAGWGRARDAEFSKSIEQAMHHFHRCGRCHHYVCDGCWNADRGICMDCETDVQAEVEATRMQDEIDAATEKARTAGTSLGETRDVKTQRQLVCPKCGTETHGAKYCPDCGDKRFSPALWKSP